MIDKTTQCLELNKVTSAIVYEALRMYKGNTIDIINEVGGEQ